MGLRGPAPLRQVRTDELKDLAPPDYLGKAARAYWRRHAAHLAGNGLLTLQTADAYALLCDLWGRLRQFDGAETNRAFLDCQKAFSVALKEFRLSPTAKTAEKEDRYEDFGEFEDGGDK